MTERGWILAWAPRHPGQDVRLEWLRLRFRREIRRSLDHIQNLFTIMALVLPNHTNETLRKNSETVRKTRLRGPGKCLEEGERAG